MKFAVRHQLLSRKVLLLLLLGFFWPVVGICLLHQSVMQFEVLARFSLALSTGISVVSLACLYCFLVSVRGQVIEDLLDRLTRRMMITVGILLNVFVFVLALLAVRSDFYASRLTPATVYLDLENETIIVSGSIDRMISFRVERETRNLNACRISIASYGGDLLGAENLARIVRYHACEVEVHEHCASACLIVLAASPQPSIPDESRLGLHGYSIVPSGGSTLDGALTANGAQHFQSILALGFPRSAVEEALLGGSKDIFWITGEQLRANRDEHSP